MRLVERRASSLDRQVSGAGLRGRSQVTGLEISGLRVFGLGGMLLGLF